MTGTTTPVAILVLITLVGFASIRRLAMRTRFLFEAACFLAISGYFIWQGIFPMFPPLSGKADAGAVALRVVGGTWWLIGARLCVLILSFAVQRDRRSRQARLFSDLAAAGIYVAAALVVLNSVFALPITGVVATSGVVAIVLGLALQNTLSDVFSGIAVEVEGPFHVGDRIQLNDKVEGQVVQVNWRSIRIQTDDDDVAIIPNSIVAKAEIVNRSFPSQRRAASVELSCPEGATPERVIETLLHAILLCPNILQAPAPSAVVVQLGPKRNVYKITFYIGATKDLSGTKDMLLRAARRQLHYAGLLDKTRAQDQARLDMDDEARAARRLVEDIILFECLADEQIAALTRELQPHRLEPGELLFAQGQADEALYLVASGVIELSRASGEISETLGRIGAGEYVGEIGLLTGAVHAATARARTHALVHRLPQEALTPLLDKNAGLAAAFDKSARKGLEILHRSVAARATPEIGGPGQLLMRIRSFFRFGEA